MRKQSDDLLNEAPPKANKFLACRAACRAHLAGAPHLELFHLVRPRFTCPHTTTSSSLGVLVSFLLRSSMAPPGRFATTTRQASLTGRRGSSRMRGPDEQGRMPLPASKRAKPPPPSSQGHLAAATATTAAAMRSACQEMCCSVLWCTERYGCCRAVFRITAVSCGSSLVPPPPLCAHARIQNDNGIPHPVTMTTGPVSKGKPHFARTRLCRLACAFCDSSRVG
jgi:hypothetical protein